MKGTLNPLSIFKVRKYRKQNSNIGKFPYSRARSIHGRTRKGKNNYSHKNYN